MSKANTYKYYLANGATIEYALSPDCSLIGVIDGIVTSHFNATQKYDIESVWVQPRIAADLNREATRQISLYVTSLKDPGMGVFRLQTMHGPVTIVAKSDLKIPIFFGSEQELEDNAFNTLMEDILA